MSEEKLMRKYRYGYKHSKDLLKEPYVIDLQQQNKAMQDKLDKINAWVDKKMKMSLEDLRKDHDSEYHRATKDLCKELWQYIDMETEE